MSKQHPARRGSVPTASGPFRTPPAAGALPLAGWWSGPTAAEPVLFYAERDPKVLFGAWLLVVLTMLPFGLAIPGTFFPGALVSLAGLMFCRHTFRLEFTGRHLRYRPNAIAPLVTVPLADVQEVMATDLLGREAGESGPGPERGHLLIRTRTSAVVVKSILKPREAAEALATLREGRA